MLLNIKVVFCPNTLDLYQAQFTLGGSLQNGLGDVWTCGTTLASAYVLHYLSATWLQLQMIGKSLS